MYRGLLMIYILILRGIIFLNTKKNIYLITITLWLLTALYFIYKFASNAGYWKNPLLISVLFYILMIVLNKGIGKIEIYIGLFYVLFVIVFILYLIFSLNNLAFPPNQ